MKAKQMLYLFLVNVCVVKNVTCLSSLFTTFAPACCIRYTTFASSLCTRYNTVTHVVHCTQNNRRQFGIWEIIYLLYWKHSVVKKLGIMRDSMFVFMFFWLHSITDTGNNTHTAKVFYRKVFGIMYSCITYLDRSFTTRNDINRILDVLSEDTSSGN